MKILKPITILLLLFSFAFAQDNALDAEADAILKAVSEKYSKYASAKMDLKLTIDLPENEENQVADVKAWFKGDMFKVDLKDQMFVSDNVTIWNYLKEYNEVQINDYEEDEAMFSPSMLFNLYTKDYIYRLKEEYKNSAGKLIKVIELTPVNKDQNFFKIDLKVDPSSNTIVESKIYERSGMRYTYLIKSFTPNITLEDKFFSFDPKDYPEIDVTDARF
ncbi:MAG: outer membrane lipoprotein carrier protein [Chitinophagales bacterium]|jgi:outer membrane lipoprotein carrier protein